MISESDWAYAAGFFDGEGHIRICAHSKRSRCYQLGVSVVQATKEPVDWFAEKFGGTWSSRISKYRGTDRAVYSWQSSNRVAERFLRGVRPFIRTKCEELDLALKFMSLKRDQSNGGGRSRLTQEEVSAREQCAALMKKLRVDKRGVALEAIRNV